MKTPLQRAGIRNDYRRSKNPAPEKQIVIQKVPSSRVDVVYHSNKLNDTQMDKLVSGIQATVDRAIQNRTQSQAPASQPDLERKLDTIIGLLQNGTTASPRSTQEDISISIDDDISGQLASSQGKIESKIENTEIKEKVSGKIDLAKLRALRKQTKVKP